MDTNETNAASENQRQAATCATSSGPGCSAPDDHANKRCYCKEWLPNIEKINGPIIMQTLRSGGNYVFNGEPFHFCPWCGKELVDKEMPDKPNPGVHPSDGASPAVSGATRCCGS